MQNSVKWKHSRELIWKKCIHASGRQFFKKVRGTAMLNLPSILEVEVDLNVYWHPVREIIRALLTEFS